MRRLVRFLALSGGDKLLLIQAFATLIGVRLALPLVSIGRLRAWACRLGDGGRPVDRIAWAGRAAARWVPGTTCLGAALAMQRLLSSSGHRGELHIGVARENARFAAHAWVECDGEVLVGEHERDLYTRLVAWRATAPPI